MTTHYYTASSLDGFIATADHSLDWLLSQDIDEDGPMAYPGFRAMLGAMALGATTYEWVLEHEGAWPYTLPAWVFTHSALEVPDGGSVRLTAADVREVHAEMTAAAEGKDLWIVGGGDLAGQFADAGLLDTVWIHQTPVVLGAGKPLLPRRLRLHRRHIERDGQLTAMLFDVVGPEPRPGAEGDGAAEVITG